MDYKLLIILVLFILLCVIVSSDKKKTTTEGFDVPCNTGFFIKGDDMRRYTKKECDSVGGNHYANGECLNPAGGSYSWNCRRAIGEYGVAESSSMQAYIDGNYHIITKPCDTGFFIKGDDMRRYTKKECDSIGGNHYANGECLNPKGGSYSWNCRRSATKNNVPEASSMQAYIDGNFIPSQCTTGVFVKGEDMRRYTKDQCDSVYGTHYPNGECLNPKGGSYSWDCRRASNYGDGIKEVDDFAVYSGQIPAQEVDMPDPCQIGVFHSDKEMRVYTKEECDSLDGRYFPNGECLKKTSGSYSWQCRKEVSEGMNIPVISNETNELDNNQPNDENGVEQEVVEEQEEESPLPTVSEEESPLPTVSEEESQEETQPEEQNEDVVVPEESEEQENQEVQIAVEGDNDNSDENEVVAIDKDKPLAEQLKKKEESTEEVKIAESKPVENKGSPWPSFSSLSSSILICCCCIALLYYIFSGPKDDVVDGEFDDMMEGEELLE